MAGGSTVILDTCALLWLASGDRKLSGTARREINAAAVVYVVAISGFEIGLKVAQGKLKLPHPPRVWFDKVAEHHQLAIVGLDLNVCVAAAQLPRIHNDPCDRFIIAAAKLHGLAVVTADDHFEKYGVAVLS